MPSRTVLTRQVIRLAHTGSRAYGWLTADVRMLPGFLVVGGQRCGTTSMYRALAAHPAVLKAVWHKGVHYFDTGYRHGRRWYRAHFPMRRTARGVQRRVGAPAQTFESSPYYLYHPLAPERIARDLPGVRLLVLVRDPVQRASSQHAHELARGYETQPDFAAALALEPARLAGQTERLAAEPGYHSHAHQHHAYRARGQYADYLDRLAGAVGRERILVVDSGRFFSTPETEYDRVLSFLGLPALGYPPFERHNARTWSALPAGLHAELSAWYEPYDERLTPWLGRPPSWRS